LPAELRALSAAEFLDLDALGEQLLVGAGLGAVVGAVFGLLSKGGGDGSVGHGKWP